ncbi:MAG TPA: RNA polymerase sigma factor [Gemmatimonadaceae bacterium]|nr:RNA polymerase sigma factor [Gemmatimonadaceae bacterium]
MTERSDADLVATVLSGDVDAFAHLVKRYQDVYRRFATRVLGSADDADDVLQLAFVRGFRSLRQCQNPVRFGGWLFQIVINECRTFAARRARRERRIVRDQAALETTAAWGDLPGRDERESIQLALNRLDADQREAFVLKHVEELSYDEMAVLTGAGVSALKMRVKRACGRLRELLEGVPHDG